MKTSDQFILRKIADEHLLIPVREAAISVKGLVALSESGGLLYKKLQEGCTREDLIAALMAEYEVSEAVAAEDTDAFLDQMQELNMLVVD
ncbi:MAG: PqqD family protein [Oscillospiraceae bacterium]|nr:PqqD family protein [Oscillospiraceae bacterium]